MLSFSRVCVKCSQCWLLVCWQTSFNNWSTTTILPVATCLRNCWCSSTLLMTASVLCRSITNWSGSATEQGKQRLQHAGLQIIRANLPTSPGSGNKQEKSCIPLTPRQNLFRLLPLGATEHWTPKQPDTHHHSDEQSVSHEVSETICAPLWTPCGGEDID